MDWAKLAEGFGSAAALVFVVWWGMQRAETIAQSVLDFLSNHLSANTQALRDVSTKLGELSGRIAQCPQHRSAKGGAAQAPHRSASGRKEGK